MGTQKIFDDFVTPEEVAQELKVSTRTLSRWHVLRIGPPRKKVGRMIRYSVADLRAWLSSRKK